jgi:hypothetical protein
MSTPRFGTASGLVDQKQVGLYGLGECNRRSFAKIQIVCDSRNGFGRHKTDVDP